MKYLYGILGVCLFSLIFTGLVGAECRVLSSDPTYTAGQLKDLTCGTNGSLRVGGGPGSATAAAPTLTEGSAGSFSFDLIGNVRVTNGTALAGERNIGVAGKDYSNSLTEANVSIISKTTAVTIGAGAANDTFLLGLLLTQALAGTCVITGFADSDGAAQSYTLPVATTAGFKSFVGAKNSAGALTITCSTAGDDNVVMVYWRPAL